MNLNSNKESFTHKDETNAKPSRESKTIGNKIKVNSKYSAKLYASTRHNPNNVSIKDKKDDRCISKDKQPIKVKSTRFEIPQIGSMFKTQINNENGVNNKFETGMKKVRQNKKLKSSKLKNKSEIRREKNNNIIKMEIAEDKLFDCKTENNGMSTSKMEISEKKTSSIKKENKTADNKIKNDNIIEDNACKKKSIKNDDLSKKDNEITKKKKVTFKNEDEVFKYKHIQSNKQPSFYSKNKEQHKEKHTSDNKTVNETTIIVSNVSHKENENTISDLFKSYGTIKEIKMIKNRTSNTPDKFKIIYTGRINNHEMLNNEIIHNNKILKVFQERTVIKKIHETEKSGKRVMINHMNKHLRIINIRSILRENSIPRVKDIRIKNEGDRRKNPGYCFIEFKTPETAVKFVENFAQMLDKFGNGAKVEFANEKIALLRR